MPRNQPPNLMFSPTAVSLGAVSREQQGGVRSAAQLGMRGPPLCRLSQPRVSSLCCSRSGLQQTSTNEPPRQPASGAVTLLTTTRRILQSHQSHSSQSPVIFLTVIGHIPHSHRSHSSQSPVTFLTATFPSFTCHIPQSTGTFLTVISHSLLSFITFFTVILYLPITYSLQSFIISFTDNHITHY